MSSTIKKVIAVVSITAFSLVGSAIPASAATHVKPMNVWCC